MGRGRGRRVTDEVIQLPEIGERTIYVTDEGLIVSTARQTNVPDNLVIWASNQ